VMLGPVTIDRETLPRAPNIHWLGMKTYEDLPSYIAGWDVALMPFAVNCATRFVNPTKTLELLAAGRSIVSTAVADVVHPYGDLKLVHIGDRSNFVARVEAALRPEGAPPQSVLERLLAKTSWDASWQHMTALIGRELARAHAQNAVSVNER
jgi:hypothetical protein